MRTDYLAGKPEDLKPVAKDILSRCRGSKLFAFSGDLGSGKTTFIAALCDEIGVKDQVVSPTFAIVHEYSNGEPVYHIDCYRIQNLAEAIDIGMNDYISGKNYCFIEWANAIEALLPEKVIRIEMTLNEDGSRMISSTC